MVILRYLHLRNEMKLQWLSQTVAEWQLFCAEWQLFCAEWQLICADWQLICADWQLFCANMQNNLAKFLVYSASIPLHLSSALLHSWIQSVFASCNKTSQQLTNTKRSSRQFSCNYMFLTRKFIVASFSAPNNNLSCNKLFLFSAWYFMVHIIVSNKSVQSTQYHSTSASNVMGYSYLN